MASAPKVLRSDVCDVDKRADRTTMSEWAVLKCTSTDAVDKGDEALAKAVTLLVRVADSLPVASFGIRLNNRKLSRRIKADREPIAYVESADDRVLVLSQRFGDREDSERLLVYDAADTSLVVVPSLTRWYCTPSFTAQPFPLRSTDHGSGFALAIMVRCHMYDAESGREFGQDALCLWPPPPSSKPHPQGCIEPWQLKEPVFWPAKPAHFSAHDTFSFQGRAFWADLGKGILSCRCDDVLSGGYKVDFSYAQLPPECLFSQHCEKNGRNDLSWSRAMGRCSVDGSIKLICIGKGCDCKVCGGPEAPGDMVVVVWAFDLYTWQWRKDSELHVSSLWKMAGFKEAGLPQVQPILPVLSTQEDGDYILHFKLEKNDPAEKDAQGPVYLCGINLRTKTMLQGPPCVLSQSTALPHVFSSDFLQKHNSSCLLALAGTDSQMFPVPPKRVRVEEHEDYVHSVVPF